MALKGIRADLQERAVCRLLPTHLQPQPPGLKTQAGPGIGEAALSNQKKGSWLLVCHLDCDDSWAWVWQPSVEPYHRLCEMR